MKDYDEGTGLGCAVWLAVGILVCLIAFAGLIIS